MKQIAFIVMTIMGLTNPKFVNAGTIELQKYQGDKRTCVTIPGNEKIIKQERRGVCVLGVADPTCPGGYCRIFSKPSRNGTCPSGNSLSPCINDGDAACGSYTLEKTVGKPGRTECTTNKGGYLKSEIIYPDEIELREGEHAEIKVKGDCTAIKIGSKGGRIIPREERVCGTGNVKITKQPGAEGADVVEIKAQIVQ